MTPQLKAPTAGTKPRLLVVELWGLGDLVIATPFLRVAAQRYEVTVLAKPYAIDLQARLWPGVTVVPFTAPWTAFKHKDKYRLYAWPWRGIARLHRQIGGGQFDVGLSARWDPRDHFLLLLAGARDRLGFPRLGSKFFLTRPLERPDPQAHRYKHWRVLAQALGLEMPARPQIPLPAGRPAGEILIHSGAGQPVRVWPLERYRTLAAHLRKKNYRVQVVCDPDQREWWQRAGETSVLAPHTVAELITLADRASVFIGNDSGPGHLAAFCGAPTFTLFGPQLPEWFAPLHPAAEWIEGKVCPYMPCSDYCRFPTPFCLWNISEAEVLARVERFAAAHVQPGS
jgi:ADP-heptose:LPS heptosyltransferase